MTTWKKKLRLKPTFRVIKLSTIRHLFRRFGETCRKVVTFLYNRPNFSSQSLQSQRKLIHSFLSLGERGSLNRQIGLTYTVLEPAVQQTSRPADQQISRSTDQQTIRPADQRTSSPADQQISRPSDHQTSRPSVQQTSRPSDQQSIRPADKQTSRQADQQTSRPSIEQHHK